MMTFQIIGIVFSVLIFCGILYMIYESAIETICESINKQLIRTNKHLKISNLIHANYKIGLEYDSPENSKLLKELYNNG